MYKVIAVEFLNTLPFIKAFQNSSYLTENSELRTADPSICAQELLNGNADIALLPIGSLIDFDQLYLLTDYGIGANGVVKTVGLFSNKKWDDIIKIKQSAVSRTSNILLECLNKHFWKSEKIILKPDEPSTADAQLIIGDEAFRAHKHYKHYYDLSEFWKKYTKMPFVFASWMSHRRIDQDFISALNQAFKKSTNPNSLTELAYEFGEQKEEMDDYFKSNIQYQLNNEMIESMQYFFSLNKWNWNIQKI